MKLGIVLRCASDWEGTVECRDFKVMPATVEYRESGTALNTTAQQL